MAFAANSVCEQYIVEQDTIHLGKCRLGFGFKMEVIIGGRDRDIDEEEEAMIHLLPLPSPNTQ